MSNGQPKRVVVRSSMPSAIAGSLIVALPCEEGLVIMADKLGKHGDGFLIHSQEKLTPMNEVTLVGSTGIAMFGTYISAETVHVVFDADNVFRAAFNGCSYDAPLSAKLESASEVLDKAFQKFLIESGVYLGNPPDNGTLFQLIVFHYSSAPEIHVLRYPFPGVGGKYTWRKQSEEDLWDRPAFGNDAYLTGNVMLTAEQMNERQLLLDDYIERARRKDLATETAISIAAKFVLLSSRYIPLSETNPIGDTVDVYLLTKHGTKVLYPQGTKAVDILDNMVQPNL